MHFVNLTGEYGARKKKQYKLIRMQPNSLFFLDSCILIPHLSISLVFGPHRPTISWPASPGFVLPARNEALLLLEDMDPIEEEDVLDSVMRLLLASTSNDRSFLRISAT